MTSRYPGGLIRKNAANTSITGASGVWDLGSQAQAVKNNTWPISGLALPVSGSLRFRAAASPYLNRTVSSTSNRQKFTISVWFKRTTFGAYQGLIQSSCPNPPFGNTFDCLRFNNSDQLEFAARGGNDIYLVPSMLFRDPSAWYHVVVAVDTTQATSTNRVKFYVNGSQISAFASTTYPSQNYNFNGWNVSSYNIAVGPDSGLASQFFDGYMAEINVIDGQQLDVGSFGQTSAITGVWEPVKYTGTYGTNGFYLSLSDTSSIGKDFSGNGNNLTPSNISTTNDYTYDLSYDVPVSWTPRDGSSVRGNYCILSPLTVSGGTLAEAGLRWSPGGNNATIWSSFAVNTGKWYFEMTKGSSGDAFIAFSQQPKTTYQAGEDTTSLGLYLYYTSSNLLRYNATSYNFSSSFGDDTEGTVYGVTLDFDTSTLTISRNNDAASKYTYSMPADLTALPLYIGYSVTTTWPSGQLYWNFGQRPFTYSIPSGFKSLCTTNLPTPTIGATTATAANKYFDTTLYNGNNGTQNITNAGGFQPDFVWIKARNIADNHFLYDSLRGATKYHSSDTSTAEGTISNGLTSFNSNGFSLGDSGSTNNSSNNFVAWQWKSTSSNTTNTSGTITSIVRANQTAGFSIVNYTGDGTNGRTVGHGLGTTPAMIIMKNRLASSDWNVWHQGLGSKGIYLNFTDAAQNNNNAWLSFNSTLPGSSVFTVGNSGVTNGGNFIAYCWSEIAGYSAFGSYTGNGSTNGPFVYTGFRPRYVLIKKSNSSGTNWIIQDTVRETYNASNYATLAANSSSAEPGFGSGTFEGNFIDYLSNGFKLRSNAGNSNASGDTYIYAAFAETPFKNSLAR